MARFGRRVPRRDSNGNTRGNNLDGRDHKSTDYNKGAGGGHGKYELDDNAHPPGGGGD
jgi:hypothetical protein